MTTLKAERRNPEIKAKKLRREGFATGVLFGREMKESLPLQFAVTDALRFIKENKEGAQVILDMGSERVSAVVKNIDYDSMKRQILALDLQALVAGEKVSTTVPVRLLNESSVQGFVDQELAEIHYKADPANLLEPIEIDCAGLPREVKSFYVKDLKLGEGKVIDLITPEDTLIFHIAEHVKNMEVEENADDETAAAE